MRTREFRAPSEEDGFILVTVLIVIAVLLPLVLAFSSKVQLNLIEAENFRNSLQASRTAANGVTFAMGILANDDPTYDSRNDMWATSFPSVALGEGASQGVETLTIKDEDGKIPVNKLIKDTKTTSSGVDKTGKSDPVATTSATTKTDPKTGQTVVDGPVDKEVEARLRALIVRLGGNPAIVDALIDWIDPDDEQTGSEGAENEFYKTRGYSCKNGPLDSLDELLMVRGFDNELVNDKKLRDYLTVAPSDGKTNVNTAPLEVLQVVLGTVTLGLAQPLNESDIDDLYRYREAHELKNTRDIGSAIKISQDQLGRIGGIVKVNSSYFTVDSRYTIGKVVKRVQALLKRDGTNLTIVSWREF